MATKFALQMLGQVLAAVAGLAMFAQPAMSVELNPYLSATKQGQPKGDAGVNFVADALNLRGAITTNRAGAETLVMPQLTSSFALASDLKLETRTTFANWNERIGAKSGDAVETKLTARSVLPMVAEIQGLVGRDAAGTSHRKLFFKMNDATVPSFLSEPIQLKTNASIEQVGVGNAQSSLLTGVEANLSQKTSASAYNRIGLKYTSQSGATESQRQAATFSRSWAQNKLLHLGVEYELMHEATNLQNAIRFTWQGSF